MTKKKDSGGFMQISLLLCASVLFAAGIGLGYASEPASATATFAAGVFCLIFAFLSRFKRFKGLGIEAELWEQKQEEAAQLVETLRSLSLVVSEQLMSLSTRMGRWDSGSSRKELFDLVNRLENILNEVNVPADQREKMKTDFYRFTAIDMARPITNAIKKAVEAKEADQRDVLAGFGSPIRDAEGYGKAAERLRAISGQKADWERIVPLAPNLALCEALEKTIGDADCLTHEERIALRASIADEIADLREWVTNRRLRRPEHWFAGDTE